MVFDNIQEYGCEEVAFCHHETTGLKAIVVIHDTTLGPALGGTRLWDYGTEEEALIDALRLARGMTRKASISGVDAGGAKAVIIAEQEQKTGAFLRAYGRFVDTFHGRFITGEDVGINMEDARTIAKETEFILGISKEVGDPSPFTAQGVVSGMRACTREVFGTADLSGLKIAVQGLGAVGYNLAQILRKEGAELIVTDIREELGRKLAAELGATVVSPEEIYSVECDVFAPCALGAAINDATIPRLRCSIVAGSANNQLKENAHGDELHRRGILYAPDYAINAGGLISAYMDWKHYPSEEILQEVQAIEQRIGEIISASKNTGKPPHIIADEIADERVHMKKPSR
ncbi:MAG: Leu/Phe/Val dehydrogenase [Thermodesulfobacteriota bacterium]